MTEKFASTARELDSNLSNNNKKGLLIEQAFLIMHRKL